MLTIIVPGDEYFDETTSTFSTIGDVRLELEHSLLSLSKWESKFQKPFLGPTKKSTEEILGYIESMILTKNYPPDILSRFTPQNFSDVNDYVDSKHTATTFGLTQKGSGRGEIVTSELIYYWMITFTIPFECESWHLNRLFTLIRICSIKNSKPKKMSRSELAARNRELNEQRRMQLGTTG